MDFHQTLLRKDGRTGYYIPSQLRWRGDNKILNIKPCMGHISGTWELLLCEYWRKSIIIGEQNMDLKRLTGQSKWATSSPWFHWNCPISVKKRSFSRPVSLFKSIFCSPIIILFLQYSTFLEYGRSQKIGMANNWNLLGQVDQRI
jgi:hypothetical protein